MTIVAETFPGDPKTIKYCSNWAVSRAVILLHFELVLIRTYHQGGHHVSHASGDPRMQSEAIRTRIVYACLSTL